MTRPIRVAAAGDIHCSLETRDRLAAAFRRVEPEVDMFLLAGDLTTLGEPEQAEALAGICRDLEPRVVAVLGNHDWHANRVDEIVATLEGAGVTMLNPGTTTCDIDGTSVGVAGTKVQYSVSADDLERNIRTHFSPMRQARYKPAACKSVSRRHAKRLLFAVAFYGRDCGGKPFETIANDGEKTHSCLGQCHRSRATTEERTTAILFEQPNLVTDRGRCNAEFSGRGLET